VQVLADELSIEMQAELTRHCHRELTHPVVMFCVS